MFDYHQIFFYSTIFPLNYLTIFGVSYFGIKLDEIVKSPI